MANSRIIILDDSPGQELGAQVRTVLRQESHYRVELVDRDKVVADRQAAGEAPPDLIIPVLPVSRESAAQLLAKFRAAQADTPLLAVLRAEALNQTLPELRLWNTDFLVTPLRAAEVLTRVRRLLPGSGEGERARIKQSIAEFVGLAQLVGEDPAIVAVKQRLLLLARCEAPVLLTGETGTGKGLCARALHYFSRRAGKPFLSVNCGGIPVELFERELFGHQKGAFTGAWAAQPGLIAEAEGGTLFLDEVETLSPGAQVKLLHFVEDQTYYPLGSPRPRHADLRILAATNVDLARKVHEGTFREDLFYRLAVLTLTLPPLRERRGDIPRLVTHLWPRYAAQQGEERKQLSPRALEALCRYDWPGNIRELENVLQQVAVLMTVQTIEPEHLPIKTASPPAQSPCRSLKQRKAEVIEQFEKGFLTELLREHQGNVTRAARAAQTERRALGRLIKKYRIAAS